MKKNVRFFILISILFLVPVFSCFAATYEESLKKSFELEGFVDKIHSVSITLLTETGSLGYGTPFDITGDDVQYNAVSQDVGRRVANWDFYSSTSTMKITIVANKMYFNNDPSITLDYIISFKYKYAVFDANGNYTSDETGYIQTNSKTDGVTKTIVNKTGTTYYPIISSANQPINFMFMEGVYPDSDDYPVGDYTAEVTITFTGE
jgi:hypothetical protein